MELKGINDWLRELDQAIARLTEAHTGMPDLADQDDKRKKQMKKILVELTQIVDGLEAALGVDTER